MKTVKGSQPFTALEKSPILDILHSFEYVSGIQVQNTEILRKIKEDGIIRFIETRRFMESHNIGP